MNKKRTGRLFLIITYVIIGCLLLGYTTYCLISCSHDQTLYTLTCLSNNTNYGEVTIIGDDQYAVNDEVHVASVAKEGYEIESWTINGEVVGTDPDIIFKMPSQDTEIIANFAPCKFEVVVSYNADITSVTGNGIHNYNEEVTLTATPFEGYKFSSWYDINNSKYIYDEEYTFIMPQKDVSISLAVYPIYYNIHITGDDDFYNAYYVRDFGGNYNTDVYVYFNKKPTTYASHVTIEGIYAYEDGEIGEKVHEGGANFSVKVPAHDLSYYVKTTYTE